MKKSWKYAIVFAFLIVICLALPTQAATKANYSIKSYTKNYKYKTASYEYLFQLPQLKGSSSAVTKINKSLKALYTNDKKVTSNLKKLVDNYGSYNRKMPLFCKTTCKCTYNKNNVVSFCFYSDWFGGGVHNASNFGATFSLKTGKKLTLTSLAKGSSFKDIKNKILSEFNKTYSNCYGKSRAAELKPNILNRKDSDFAYYIKPGKVVVSFGAYGPIGHNGEHPVTITGKYK